MAKDYNIDDILSEVKKRREENERRIKAEDALAAEAEKPVKKAPKEPEKIKKEAPAKDKKEALKDKTGAQPEPVKQPAAEEKAEPVKEEKSEIREEAVEKKTEPEKNAPEKKEDEKKAQPQQIKQEQVEEEEEKEPQKDEYIDINSFVTEPEEEPEEQPKKKSKKKKIIISIICVILALLIALGVGGYLYVDRVLDKISSDDVTDNTQQEELWSGMDVLVESFEPINEDDAKDIASLREMIRKWYYNGTPCSSSHVLNVLLVGEDGYDEEEESRADSAIIASINVDTETITLTSVLRDTYAYWEVEPGNEETGEFGKINGAKASGDITTYINAVEHLYKVKIDNYATVDFESFKTIIDSLGGVDIEITQAEINEINNDQKTYDGTWIDKTFEGKSGVMRLNGQQALSYCRIRHLDSDNMRADRQKKCLTQILNGLKDASSVKLLGIINDLVPYVKTDMRRDMLIKVAKYALSEGWMQYDVVTNTVPNSRINERGAGGIYYGAWCWKSDFPQDAYNLQTLIYGKSSITLARTRVDVLRCRESGYKADGYGAVGATFINEHYGEVSTLPETTTEENQTNIQ